MDYSEIAAALGRRGGKASKRPPGPLRRILMDICREVGSTDNGDVFSYWQRHNIAASADNSPRHTCWARHSLYVKYLNTRIDYDLPIAFYAKGGKLWCERPRYRERPPASKFTYFYFDGERDRKTTAPTIRRTLYRIRTDDSNRLSVTGG